VSDLYVKAIEAIYEAASAPANWPRALQAIADFFGDVGTVMLWHRDDGAVGSFSSPALELAQADYQERGWNRRDIRASRALRALIWVRGETVTERDFMLPGELDTEPFYTDFLASHGLRYCLATGISPDPRVAVALSVQRAIGRPEYSTSEVESMAQLGRHAERSLRLSMRLLDAELANLGLSDALARVGIGVFALDSMARVVFANPAAERLYGESVGLVNGQLRIGTNTVSEVVATAISSAVRGNANDLTAEPKPIPVRRASSNRPLIVYVLPIANLGTLTEQFLTHTRAIVLVIEPEADAPADPAVVRDLLGLTFGEARVASLVGSGIPPRAAALQLGISEETARTVLKRVFSKVGVSRQGQLVALLSKLVMR
jgi:DNA-binding CsgD family transcriptional regulator/PAS domain-containing protein